VKLRVEDITADSKELAFAEPDQEINRILSAGPIHEFHVEGPVAVTVSYYRAGTDLFFEGRFVARVGATCARCADDFDAPCDRHFRFMLSPKSVGYEAEDNLRADDLEFSLYEGEQVDLSPLIREQLILALPTRALCREDCRGLCPRCGANLNQGECGCRAETFDPRLAPIRSLKLNRS
jgi:DUF177 domain-containing protein